MLKKWLTLSLIACLLALIAMPLFEFVRQPHIAYAVTENITINATWSGISNTVRSIPYQTWAVARSDGSGQLEGGYGKAAVADDTVANQFLISRTVWAFDLTTVSYNITSLDDIVSVSLRWKMVYQQLGVSVNPSCSLYKMNSTPTNGVGGTIDVTDFPRMLPTTSVTSKAINASELPTSGGPWVEFPIYEANWGDILWVADGWAYVVAAISYDANDSAPTWVSSAYRNFSTDVPAGSVVLEVIRSLDSAPTVVTNSPSVPLISTTGATLSGNITDLGTANVTDRGFVWDTVSRADPGIATAPADSAYSDYWTENCSSAIGNFTHAISGLSENTTYYYRACAYNSVGWDYGDEISFNTWHEILLFQPNSIILNSNLPDMSGHGNNGTFNWGTDSENISDNVSPPTPSSPGSSTGGSSEAYKTTYSDLLPGGVGDLTDNNSAPMQKTTTANITGISDLMNIWTDLWDFDTANIGWVFFALILTVFSFWLFAFQLQHVGYAMIAAGAVIGFFSIPTIDVIPSIGLFFAVLTVAAGVVTEVKA